MKKILISANPWQTKIAVTREGQLQNIYFASHAKQTLERSFFKGTIIKVLPGIQTAFVDIGQEKAGFLHISEIDRELALARMGSTVELEEVQPSQEQQPTYFHQPLDIGKILKEGESILVQVSKEPVYEKGAKLTTCFTLPGRFIVLMPNIPRIAISKKIEDREERMRLKEILIKNLPEGMGAIIRTTSEGRQEKEIGQDVQFLVSTWNQILKKYNEAQLQEKIYEDLPISLQIVRDHLDDDVEAVISDNQQNQQEIYKFVKKIAPEYAHKIQYYSGQQDLFEKYDIETQIQQALSEKVHLKSGGSIIIETTQAMTVIDVNTGRYTGKTDLEETILKTNLEAAEEVTRQLRLRNIGGLIVIDFIDMASSANRQKLFKFFERMLKERDKFQSVVLKITEFGLVQMTRKRSGKTLLQELTHACPTCKGLGYIKSIQTICYTMLPKIKQELYHHKNSAITIMCNIQVFDYIAHTEYNTILQFERDFKCKITLEGKEDMILTEHKIIEKSKKA
jgi:ribonuclease G